MQKFSELKGGEIFISAEGGIVIKSAEPSGRNNAVIISPPTTERSTWVKAGCNTWFNANAQVRKVTNLTAESVVQVIETRKFS